METSQLDENAIQGELEQRYTALYTESVNVYRANPDRALVALEQALEIAQHLGSASKMANTLVQTGNVLVIQSAFQDAISHYDKALALCEKGGTDSTRAKVLANKAAVQQKLGRFYEAIDLLNESIELRRKLGDKAGTRFAHYTMGVVYTNLGWMNEALEQLLNSIQLSESASDSRLLAQNLNAVGYIYLKLNHLDKAEDCLRRSVDEYSSIDDSFGVATAMNNQGKVYLERRAFQQARTHFEKSLSIRTSLNDLDGQCKSCCELADLHNRLKDFAVAEDFAIRALDLAERCGNKSALIGCLHTIGMIKSKQAQFTEALNYLTKAMTLARAIPDPVAEYDIHFSLSQAYETAGEYALSLEHYKRHAELKEAVVGKIRHQFLEHVEMKRDAEKARSEKELYRLKTVELVELNKALSLANDKLHQLNEEKNEFLGIAAHDLKNPLTAVGLHAELISRFIAKPPLDTAILDQNAKYIRRASEAMVALIDNLLDINRIETGHQSNTPEYIGPLEIIMAIMERHEAWARQKAIRLHRFGDMGAYVWCDRKSLEQIIDNLVSNAIKYSPLNSTVSVQVFREHGKVHLLVSDGGKGIPEKDRDKLFGKFQRLSTRPTAGEASTGLGLSIVKKLSDAIGATVNYSMTAELGSTFHVVFDEADPEQPDSALLG